MKKISSPNLSRRGLNVFHTWCGPSANLESRSEICCMRLAGNTGRKKSPFWYYRTTLSGYIFGTKACIDNRKKLVKLEMWANAKRDGRPAYYRWRPLFNAAVRLTPTTRVPCSSAAKMRNRLKFAGGAPN